MTTDQKPLDLSSLDFNACKTLDEAFALLDQALDAAARVSFDAMATTANAHDATHEQIQALSEIQQGAMAYAREQLRDHIVRSGRWPRATMN